MGDITKQSHILFKEILKEELKDDQIRFVEILANENVAPNIGAVSSSFNPTKNSEVELLTSEEEVEIAEAEQSEQEIQEMEEAGMFDIDRNLKRHKVREA